MCAMEELTYRTNGISMGEFINEKGLVCNNNGKIQDITIHKTESKCDPTSFDIAGVST